MGLTLLSGLGELVTALQLRGSPLATDLVFIQPLGSDQGYYLPLSFFSGGATGYQEYAGTVVIPGKYLVPTATSAQSIYLPALSSVSIGTTLTLRDQDDNAGTNNVTIYAAGSDVIFDHATSSATFPWQTSNTICEIVAQATGWRAIVYGG